MNNVKDILKKKLDEVRNNLKQVTANIEQLERTLTDEMSHEKKLLQIVDEIEKALKKLK